MANNSMVYTLNFETPTNLVLHNTYIFVGATYYPTTNGAKVWLIMFGMFSLSNFTVSIEAISSYYAKRTEEIVEALMETEDETTGMNELQWIDRVLRDAEKAAGRGKKE